MLRWLAISSLLGVALTLSACGGDESSDQSSQGSGSTTQDTGPTTAERSSDKDSTTPKAKSPKSQKSTAKAKSPPTSVGTQQLSRRARRALRQAKLDARAQIRKARAIAKKVRSKAPPPGSEREAYLAARNVCRMFLPADQVKGRDRTEVAKKYAKAWNARQREPAYRGCMVGLRLRASSGGPPPPDSE